MISGLKPLNATAPLKEDFDTVADIGIAKKSRAILPSVGNLGDLTRHQANTSETSKCLGRFEVPFLLSPVYLFLHPLHMAHTAPF
jgi:hypothetical protein